MSKKIFPCPICNRSLTGKAKAIISPWIRELGIKERVSIYLLCDECGTGSFSKRYTDAEMSKIYNNYRGDHYLKVRTKWEPWYSEKYNSNHDSEIWINNRKESLTEFLSMNGIEVCKNIIDVGGDRGQYIPDITREKIVFDISDKTTLEGVMRISSFESLPTSDLIIYAHVLEHVDEPVAQIRQLFEKSARIYVEVPFGVPEVNKIRKSKFRFLFHLIWSLNKFTWRKVTSPATGRKVSSRKMLTQSEHLTFFNEKSMNSLARQVGASIVMKRTSISTPDLNTGEVLQCVLTRK